MERDRSTSLLSLDAELLIETELKAESETGRAEICTFEGGPIKKAAPMHFNRPDVSWVPPLNKSGVHYKSNTSCSFFFLNVIFVLSDFQVFFV